jgi:hypothetical protein
MSKMQTVQKGAIWVFITAVVLLTFIAILSIWDVVANDVLYKSFVTICVIGFSAGVTVIAARGLDVDKV